MPSWAAAPVTADPALIQRSGSGPVFGKVRVPFIETDRRGDKALGPAKNLKP